jgi:adenylate cyclase class 2
MNNMQTEVEAKWLNIELDDIRRKLNGLEAKLVHPERLMVRQTYDFMDMRLNKIGGWVRVRDEGDKVTLSFKQLKDRSLYGTKEVTVVVNNFAAADSFLIAIGLESKSYQETKRESWQLGSAQIELDTWPWIPSFVEIEAASEKELKNAADKLGFDLASAEHGSVETAYQAVYDVTEKEIDGWKEIRFIDVPGWLLEKTK